MIIVRKLLHGILSSIPFVFPVCSLRLVAFTFPGFLEFLSCNRYISLCLTIKSLKELMFFFSKLEICVACIAF